MRKSKKSSLIYSLCTTTTFSNNTEHLNAGFQRERCDANSLKPFCKLGVSKLAEHWYIRFGSRFLITAYGTKTALSHPEWQVFSSFFLPPTHAATDRLF